VVEHKTIEKSVAFLSSNNEISEKKYQENNHISNSWKNEIPRNKCNLGGERHLQ
jgi:hypothetical protein